MAAPAAAPGAAVAAEAAAAALADLNTALTMCGFVNNVWCTQLIDLEGLTEIDNFGDFAHVRAV